MSEANLLDQEGKIEEALIKHGYARGQGDKDKNVREL